MVSLPMFTAKRSRSLTSTSEAPIAAGGSVHTASGEQRFDGHKPKEPTKSGSKKRVLKPSSRVDSEAKAVHLLAQKRRVVDHKQPRLYTTSTPRFDYQTATHSANDSPLAS